jgi:hypothetical protein
MEKTNNENISPSIEFNVERVAKVLFALKDEDDLLHLQEDDFKLLDREGNLTINYDENIFIQFAKGGAGGFGSNELIRQFFPEEFKDNLSFFMKIAESLSDFKEVFLELASEKILNSKNFVKAIIQNCGSHYEPVLKYFPKEICKNKDIVLSAVEKNGNNLKYASDELKKDREVVLAAIVPVLPFETLTANEAMKYADKSFLSDFEIARVAVASSGNSLQYFADEIRQDKDIVSIAVNNSSGALEFADKSLLSDKDFILSLPNKIYIPVRGNDNAFSILGDKLKKDHDIVTKAIAMDCNLYQDLPKNLKEDSLIFTEALKDTSFASRKSLPLMVENAPSIITQDIDTCQKIISKDLSFFEYLPKSIQSNKQIISFWSKLETKNYSELDEKDLIIFLSFISRDQKSWFRENEETTAQTLKKINTIEGAKSIVTYLGDLESDVFQNLDAKLLTNEEVLNAAVNAKPTYTKAPSIMEYIVSNIQEIYNRREYIEKVLRKYGSLMEFLPDNLKNDKVLAEIAIKQDYSCFKYLSEELKDNDQIINCLVLALLQKKIESSSNSFYGDILEFASNRIKENIEFAEKMSNYGYVMKEFKNDKNIVMNALEHNSYAKFGDIWDFDIAQIANISRFNLDNDNVKHIVNNKEMMGMQLILAINSSSNLVEDTKPYFDKLNYDWITDNNIGVEDEYGYGYDY